MYIAGQIVGIFVTIAAVISIQFKDMKKILLWQIISNSLLMLNFALLDAWSGAAVAIIATIQTIIMFVIRNCDNKASSKTINILTIITTIVFAVLFCISAKLTYKSPVDLLSFIASLVFCVSVIQKKSSVCRALCLINSLLWLGFDIGTGAYTTIITHAFLTCSTIVGIVRLDLKKSNIDKK